MLGYFLVASAGCDIPRRRPACPDKQYAGAVFDVHDQSGDGQPHGRAQSHSPRHTEQQQGAGCEPHGVSAVCAGKLASAASASL